MPASDARITRASIVGLAGVMVLVAYYLLHAGQGTSPFFDEWDWITRRRGISGETLLGAHNGHLSVVPVLIYKLLLQTAGLGDYWVFRTVLVGLHLGCVLLVFLLARTRVGPVGGAFAAGFVAVLGAAGDDLLWAFQIGFLVGVLLGLAALLALERATVRGDVAATVLLALSLGSASVGAAFAIAAAVELALHPRRKERWWVIAAPLVLYGAWYLGYGEGQMKRENLGDTPSYAATSGAAAAGGIFGLSVEWGRLLLVGVTAAVAARVWNADRLTPRLVALATAPASLWVLTGLSRAQNNEPAAPRYIYCGAVLLVLLVCELARGKVVPRLGAAAVLGLLLVFAAVSNANTIDSTSGFLRLQAKDMRARLGALQLVGRDRVTNDLQFSPVNAPQLTAGRTLYAEESFGQIGLTPAQLADTPQAQGLAADNVMRLTGSIATAPAATVPSPAGAAPASTGISGGTLRVRRGCVITRAESGDTRLDVDLPDGGDLLITADAATGILARRFATAFPDTPIGEIPAGGTVRLDTRGDVSTDPWHLQFASAGNLRVCRTGP